MLIFGLIALVKGKFSLTRTKTVEGVPARIVGLMLMMPLPAALMAGLAMGTWYAAQGRMPDENEVRETMRGVAVGIVLFFLALALIIAFACARPSDQWTPQRLDAGPHDERDDRAGPYWIDDDAPPGRDYPPPGHPPDDRYRR
jgi:hypothetical protein